MKKLMFVFLIFGIVLLSLSSVSAAKSFGFNPLRDENVNVNILNETEVFHNNLSGIQGGTTNEYYHIRQTWFDELTSDIFNWITQSEGDARYYELTDFDIDDYYLKSNPFSFYNSTSLQNLSQLNDDLGNRGYTNNLNFTNGANYWNDTFATFNKTYADTLYAGIEWNYNQTEASINLLNGTGLIINWSYLTNEINLSDYFNKTEILNFGYYNSTDGVLSQWITSGSDIYYSSGNIGIGESNPQQNLHIYSGNPRIRLEDSSGDDWDVLNANGDFYIQDSSDVRNDLRITGDGDIIFNGGGSVGIGTTTPSSLLTTGISSGTNEVNLSGIMYVNSTSGNVGIGTETPSSTLYVNYSGATGHGQVKGIVSENQNTWNGYAFAAATTTGKGNANYGFFVDGVAKGGMGYDRTNSYVGYWNAAYSAASFALRLNSDGSLSYHDAATATQVFNVTKDGNTYIKGNVGIGTTAPSSLFEVAHSSGTNEINLSNTLFVNSTSGNVGIGTTSPSYPLEVNGNSGGISIYASHNISATGFITRTSLYDKSKSVWDYVKDANYYTDKNGKIDHSKYYGFVSNITSTDYSKPENQSYEEEVCQDVLTNVTVEKCTWIEDIFTNCTDVIEEKYIKKCHNETKFKIEYPHTKIEQGVNLESEINLLRQAVYELKEENDLLKSRVEVLENAK